MEGITPETQLELAGRLADLIEQWGPFLFVAVLILVVYRKEIGVLILSFRRENNADALMSQMNSSFTQNLRFFEQVAHDSAKILAINEQMLTASKDAAHALQAIKEELIRGRSK